MDDAEDKDFVETVRDVTKGMTKEERAAVMVYGTALYAKKGSDIVGLGDLVDADRKKSNVRELSGVEAEDALTDIFNRGTNDVLPEEISSKVSFEKEFSNPITTAIGEVVKVGKMCSTKYCVETGPIFQELYAQLWRTRIL